MMSKKQVIGIAGAKNSGKSTVANMIRFILNMKQHPSAITFKQYKQATESDSAVYNENNTFEVAFGDELKKFVSNIFGIDIDLFYDREYKDKMYYSINNKSFQKDKGEHDTIIDLDMLNIGSLSHYISTLSMPIIKLRTLLQYIGTDICRDQICNDIWVNKTQKYVVDKLVNHDYCIISDVRMENEAHSILHNESYSGCVLLIDRTHSDIAKDNHTSEYLNIKYTDYILNDGTEEKLFNNVVKFIKSRLNIDLKTTDYEWYYRDLANGDEVYLFDTQEVKIVKHIHRLSKIMILDFVDNEHRTIKYSHTPTVLYENNNGVLDINHLPPKNYFNNGKNKVCEVEGYLEVENYKLDMYYSDINDQCNHIINVVKDSFKGECDLVICGNCGWWGHDNLLLGGGQIADTGDYNDVYCPICHSTDVADKDE